jgi:hypothetical protein
MRRSLPIRATLALVISLATGATHAMVRVGDAPPPYGNQTGDLRKVDAQNGNLTIDDTGYLYDAKSVTVRGQDNAVIGTQALRPGLRVGYSTHTNAKTGKQEISEIWILKAGSAKKH